MSTDPMSAAQLHTVVCPHPAIDYLKRTFAEDDHIFFKLIHSTKKHKDKSGNLVADVELFPLLELRKAASAATIARLEENQADGWNIYICMNPFPAGTTERKEHLIRTIRNVFIETDNNKPGGADALERIQKAVEAATIPPPHSTLQSSPGNYHIVWHVHDVTLPEARALNRALASNFGGDHACVDAHRVLRMPGFRNLKYPNRPICELIQPMCCDGPYASDQFKIQIKVAKAASGPPLTAEELAPYVERLEANAKEAEFKLGARETYGKGYCWVITCPWADQHTQGGDEAMIFMLEDARLEFNCFHGHCAERGWSDIRKLWEKKVGGRQEFVAIGGKWPEVAKTVEEFNKKFYVVENFGGKCRVCAEEPSEEFPDSFEFVHQSFSDFRNRFIHQLIKVGENEDGSGIYLDKGKVWLHHKDRQQYQQVVYAPGRKLQDNVRNLWRGFAFVPKSGDCSLYLAHLKENICQGKQDRYDWLICWMAYSVRHPNEPGHTCPVILGMEGVGKNTATDPFAKLWGAHHRIITQRSQFTGHFNAHLRALSVLIVNEAFFAGDRSQAGPMKGLITDEEIGIESKGIDVTRTRNLLHIMIVSNEDWVVPSDIGARRFTVLRSGAEKKNDIAYFKALHEQLKNGGYGALLYHLLNEVDLESFNPRRYLDTEELDEQKALSLQGIESVWYECLQRGCLPGKINEDGSATMRGSDLVDWAAKKHHRGWDSLKTEHVGHLFGVNPRAKKKGMGFQKHTDVFDEGRVNVWKIPPLTEARQHWTLNRFEVKWGDDLSGEWKVDKDWNDEQRAKEWTPPRSTTAGSTTVKKKRGCS